MMKKLRNSFLLALVLSIFALAFTLGIKKISFIEEQIEAVEKKITDLSFVYRGPLLGKDEQIEDIVIIDIDEKSINQLGQYSRWPNAFFAQAVDYISGGAPLAIGFDMFFTERDTLNSIALNILTGKILRENPQYKEKDLRKILESTSTDGILAESFRNSGVVYLGMFDRLDAKYDKAVLPGNLVSYPCKGELKQCVEIINPLPPIPELAQAAHKVGFAHVVEDTDGITRYYQLLFSYKGKNYVNFSCQMIFDLLDIAEVEEIAGKIVLKQKSGEKIAIPVDSDGNILLNFYGIKRSFRYISFSDIINQRIPQEYFENKVVLVGASAVGLQDLKVIPIDEAYPGVELHATFIYNLLNTQFIKYLPDQTYNLIIFLLTVFVLFVMSRISPVKSVITLVLLNTVIFVAVLVIFDLYSYKIYLTDLFISMNLGFIFILSYKYQTEIKERQRVKHAFSKYVSSSLVENILANPKNLKFGGTQKEVTTLFTDIKDFTTMSEAVNPEEITNFLHEYLSKCTNIVLKNDGMLDKYIGDAIVALYNVPMNIEDYPSKACMTALDMQDVIDELKLKYSDHPYFSKLFVRIGISTGKLVVGNMGSEQIFDYTGIGDIMNLGARLESLNKYYGTKILMNQLTRDKLNDSFLVRKIDFVAVKGKHQASYVWELLGHASDNADFLTKLKNSYEAAFELYFSGEFHKALELFSDVGKEFPDDPPTQVMLKRINCLLEEKPTFWDGSWVMETK